MPCSCLITLTTFPFFSFFFLVTITWFKSTLLLNGNIINDFIMVLKYVVKIHQCNTHKHSLTHASSTHTHPCTQPVQTHTHTDHTANGAEHEISIWRIGGQPFEVRWQQDFTTQKLVTYKIGLWLQVYLRSIFLFNTDKPANENTFNNYKENVYNSFHTGHETIASYSQRHCTKWQSLRNHKPFSSSHTTFTKTL